MWESHQEREFQVLDIIPDLSSTVFCTSVCETILIGVLFAIVLYPHLFVWVQKWKQRLKKIWSTACCTSLPFAKITPWNLRQRENSIFVFEKKSCWSGKARGRTEEEVVAVCFGQGPFPEVMSNMYYLNAESRKM